MPATIPSVHVRLDRLADSALPGLEQRLGVLATSFEALISSGNAAIWEISEHLREVNDGIVSRIFLALYLALIWLVGRVLGIVPHWTILAYVCWSD